MKIIYLHQYFKTPAEPGGTRSYWIARELNSRGHEVTMISGSSNIKKRKEVKNIDGIRVIYLRVPYDNSMGIFNRFLAFVRFMIGSTLVALKQKNVNLVIATSTPLTIGFPALVLNWIKKVPFLFEVRDLWPEVPIQMGALKNPVLKKIAIAFERKIYSKAKHIVALSPGMKDGVIANGVPSEKVSMIPNMAKIDQFWPRKVDYAVYDKYNINKDTFKIIHFGAMGLANGLEYIIDAADILKINNINNIEFLFVGDGSVKKKIKDEVKQRELSNISFLGKVPMNEMSEIVNACDISLVTFANLPILTTNSPNKLFDSLSAGKPIIVNSNGWTKEMVEKYECGFYVDGNKPEHLANLVKKIKSERAVIKKLGENSRKLAETKYDKSILCKEFVNIVESVINNKQKKL